MIPDVSIIIPAYNGGRYLPAAIDSVLGQTYRNYELIVVDDGSTDDTALVLQSYLDPNPNIRYVAQTNQGVGAARNHGIRLAQAKWIAFLDQDDVWLPQKLALQLECLQSQPQLGLIHSGWQIVDATGKLLSTVQPWQGLPTLDLQAWVQWKPVFLGAMLFQRDWLAQVGGFNERWQQTGDVDLALRLAASECPAAWVQQATVNYRQHAANTSRDVLEQIGELEAVLELFFSESDLPESVIRLEQASRYQSWVWSAWRAYQAGYSREMAKCLKKSLGYTSKPFTAAMCDWIDQFKQYSAEYGISLDVAALIQSAEWRTITPKLLQPIGKYAKTGQPNDHPEQRTLLE
jgi:glycosyltransferase involved in cell wall biosynthesis